MTETTVTPERPLVVEEGDVKPGFIGQNVPRKEDKRLVQGEGVFFDDVKRHEMGYVQFVRSPYAHARIKSVDVSKALELDGVYGTLTGDEVAILTDPFFELSSPPLECSGCLVEFNRGTGQWTIHGNHQMPGVGAIWMAPALRVGIDKLRFVSQDIGGGFGNKITLHPQYTACCLLARKLNRPVQWTEWRTDQHTANTHGNERTFLDVTVPVKADGTMLGFSVRAIGLGLSGYDSLEEKRSNAESRGKHFGIGIGSTLDSGTNNFGQSMILNPELQFSGNNEVATVKLDIFGEIVVTLGTVPQGQGHETTAAQVVADILGVTPDDVTVRAGHDTYWNSHAGFSGTYASQFAVTGLGAVKGATDKLAHEIKRVAAGMFGATPDDIELAEGQARLKANAEAVIPFMGIGAIVNANNAILSEDVRDVTLNCRYVYVPPFQLPDKERKYGNLTLTYATQIHTCVVEIDPETGVYDIVDYAAVDHCGQRNP